MGNKIITEKDFFECSGGMMPSPFQARQSIIKRQDGAKYITKDDISTVSWVDFGCKKVMLLYAVVAAVAAAVAALCVATGGAALIAVCAVAGAAGAALGAVVGTLICGQLVAPTRVWMGSKPNFQIQGIHTITGDHTIRCDAFTYLGMSPEFITFNPQIKSWSQAIARGAANFIGNVFEGMMAGAAIGGIAAGGAALAGAGSWANAGRVALQFVKSIPKNIVGNIIESFMVPGLTMRGVMSAQSVAAGYGETGEFSVSQAMSDAKDGFFSMETGTVDSIKKVASGNGTWQDYVGLALNLMPVGKGVDDFLSGKKKSGSTKAEGDAPSKMDDVDSAKPKTKADADATTKKVEGDAYEMDAMDRSPKYNNKGDVLMSVRDLKRLKAEMSKIGVNVIIDSKGKVLKGNLAAGYDNVNKTIYLKKNATRYEAFHESQHAKQHAEMGDAYNKQTRIEKEAYVRDQIMKNKDMFSERELNHAEAYQRGVEDPYGNWPPKDPETGLYKLD